MVFIRESFAKTNLEKTADDKITSKNIPASKEQKVFVKINKV